MKPRATGEKSALVARRTPALGHSMLCFTAAAWAPSTSQLRLKPNMSFPIISYFNSLTCFMTKTFPSGFSFHSAGRHGSGYATALPNTPRQSLALACEPHFSKKKAAAAHAPLWCE